jgi:hypothetical protein
MHQINKIFLFVLLVLLSSCIKQFTPVFDESVAAKFVVSGRVTDTEGWQQVDISFSSPIEAPEYIPASGCQVKIKDDKGNTFSLEEEQPGSYRVWMAKEYLVPGISYKLEILTPNNEKIESTYDRMIQGPVLDSVYYVIKEIPTFEPSVNLRGAQFCTDLNAEGFESRYFKWEILETWEYHAEHIKEYYYDGDWHEIIPPDSSSKVCWITRPVKNVYTVSTNNFTKNAYKQFPLQFVDGIHSNRFEVLYSILVTQLAVSEGAYSYWDQVRINSTEQGGLYEKQPLDIKGNLTNISNPGNEVLGYFYVATGSTRRFFFKDIKDLELLYLKPCVESSLDPYGGWKDFDPIEYPVYYYFNDDGKLRILSYECVDCRISDGFTTKPDFWPY